MASDVGASRAGRVGRLGRVISSGHLRPVLGVAGGSLCGQSAVVMQERISRYADLWHSRPRWFMTTGGWVARQLPRRERQSLREWVGGGEAGGAAEGNGWDGRLCHPLRGAGWKMWSRRRGTLGECEGNVRSKQIEGFGLQGQHSPPLQMLASPVAVYIVLHVRNFSLICWEDLCWVENLVYCIPS